MDNLFNFTVGYIDTDKATTAKQMPAQTLDQVKSLVEKYLAASDITVLNLNIQSQQGAKMAQSFAQRIQQQAPPAAKAHN